jgi:signal transduction histidine kinase
MSEPRVWYRSLYWRIALGLIGVLVVMLMSQGFLFVYFTYPQAGSLQSRSPAQLASIVATDLSAALTSEPPTNIEQYVHSRYDGALQPVLVAMQDGRAVTNHPSLVTPVIWNLLRRQAKRGIVPPAFLIRGGPHGQGRPRQQAAPFQEESEGPTTDDLAKPARLRPLGRDGRVVRRQFAALQPVVLNGDMVGIVAVLPLPPPFTAILREVGPTMAGAGLAILALGSFVVAVVVMGPTRRRLQHLQDATGQIGRGDFSVRLLANTGDEVADLAGAFNHMADELASRASALDASDQARRQLLADVSHELMTPLTAMRGYIETLAMPDLAPDAPTRARYLGIVDAETRRMEHIVGDLLDMARFEGGSPTIHMRDMELSSIFDRVARRHERELTERRIMLDCAVAPDVHLLRGDPNRLEQALQNLTSNALRVTPDGGRISLSADLLGDAVVLTVRDNGPGIPQAHLPFIFDRFYKADTARRATEGSGLGLSIVKAIVERHGGHITARNDNGAVFEITLPSLAGF